MSKYWFIPAPVLVFTKVPVTPVVPRLLKTPVVASPALVNIITLLEPLIVHAKPFVPPL